MNSSEVVTLFGDPAITVERDVECCMRDGVVLRADVYRPAGASEPAPVLLQRLPYDKTQAENITYAHPSWYARHGYIVVVQDCRGRGTSQGDWYPFVHEAQDGYDTIEWAAQLPGSDGRVGMYGFSYAGLTQLLPAVLQPPSLASLCPATTGSQVYEGWTYNGGALALGFAATWATDLANGSARRAGNDSEVARLGAALHGARGLLSTLPVDAYPPLDRVSVPYFYDWLDHPTYDDYWRRWSIDEDYDRLLTPALHIAGWYDIFLTGTVGNFVGMRRTAGSQAARGAQKLLIGPWHHMPWAPVDGGGGDAAGAGVVDDWQIAWFDHTLKGEVFAGPDAAVTVYVMGEKRWRHFADWPPPEAEPTAYFLHSAGRANSSYGDGSLSTTAPTVEPVDVFTYDPMFAIPSLGGQSCCYDFISPMGPADQGPAEKLNGVLCYTTAPLQDDVLLVGDSSVTLYAATSAVDTDWTARLCHVSAGGTSTNIKAGIVRARSRESVTEPSLVPPHTVVRYDIALGPIGILVPAGDRLRVTISSSDFPHWDRNLNTGGPLFREGITRSIVATQTVLHDEAHPSSITLPVVRRGE